MQNQNQPQITFNTIQEIQNHEFVGNHYSDCNAFNAIDTFVQNVSNSLSDRAEALRVMSDKGMGCGRYEEISDEETVKQYIDSL